jgi:hypothetical protein
MTPARYVSLIAVGALVTVGSVRGLAAQEGVPGSTGNPIVSYASELTVHRDSTLSVNETIKVALSGGAAPEICRDLATHYSDRFGNAYTIHFDVLSLERDGEPAEARLRKLPNGLRICLARKGEALSPGEHTYQLSLAVDRGIGFFPDHDELYWNVTGNGWVFPLPQVSATVHLPGGISPEAVLLDGYTGRPGSAQTDYTATTDPQGAATFHTTRPLGRGESLTVVIRWPKDFVMPPTDEQMHRYFLEDNQAIINGLVGLVVVLIYYFLAWVWAGRAPKSTENLARSAPPRELSPAAVGFFWRAGFDQKAVVAALVDLAVRKRLAILEDATGAFILGPPPADTTPGLPGAADSPLRPISPDEKLVLARLFATDSTIRLEPAYRARLGGVIEALHRHLRSKAQRLDFITTGRYLLPGLVLSAATVIRSGLSIQGALGPVVLGTAIVLLPWGLGCMAWGSLSVAAGKNALSEPYHARAARQYALVTGAIFVGLVLVEIAGFALLAWAASAAVLGLLVLLLGINCLFHLLLRSPRRAGRALADQMEDFRSFLATVGQERPGTRPSGANAAALFERLLPYAMAMNVEKVWGEKFAAALAQAGQKGTAGYAPAWYSGPCWDPVTVSNFATALDIAFSSAITSAMKRPVRRRSVQSGSRRSGTESGGASSSGPGPRSSSE